MVHVRVPWGMGRYNVVSMSLFCKTSRTDLRVAALVMQSSHIVHISDTVQLLLVRLMLWDAQRIVFGRFASKSLTVDLMKSHAVKPFPTAKIRLEMLQALTH